jgi:dienelactone hydrolase
MPFNLAVFDVNGADRAMKEVPNIKNWYIGGHSLGGAMASSYAAKNNQKLNGVILLGAYPASDLSKTNLHLLCMYGTKDGVMNRQKFADSKLYSPQNTKTVEIDGGNHAYFGSYGEQKGDGTAAILPEAQQTFAAREIANFVKNS